MVNTVRGTAASPGRRHASVALIAAGSLFASVAHAGLGETVDSVRRDHEALHGTTLTVTPMQAYDIHETTLADGSTVRQYVSHSGTVFAVAWSGRGLPSLQVLLAKHYDEYVTAAAAHRGSHHVFNVATPDLVVSITRITRASSGRVHVPALVPAGTSVQELR
jgi:hypothetical protein